MKWPLAGWVVVALAISGCSRPTSTGSTASAASTATAPATGASSTPASSAATSAAAPASSAITLGAPITATLVSLSDLAHDPAKYKDKVIATSGKVTSVCREMGCWMELQDATGQAHVRMHGHSFFVPKTSPGHLARVQATVVKSPNAADDCEEKPSSSVAKIELDATGVEID